MQKKLRAKAQEEKARGKEVKIGYRKVIVDGKEWRWNRNKEMLEEVGTKY